MATKAEKNSGYWIKPKVLAGFTLILVFSIVSIVITYRGFMELNLTRQGLSHPGQKLALINAIVTDIYGEETDIRTFILTNDANYIENYLEKQKKLSSTIRSLDKLTSDNSDQNRKVKQIAKLLESKRATVVELIELRRNDTPDKFYDEALSHISYAGKTAQRSSAIARTTTVTTSKRDTVYKKSPDNGLVNKIKRFFVGPTLIDTVTTKVEVETKLDTIPYGSYVSDSIIQNLVDILNRIRLEQKNYRINLSSKELELLERDKNIMERIHSVINLLERQELSASFRQSIEVQDLVGRSIIKVLALGAFTFMLLLILLAVIFRDISKSTLYRNQLLEAKQYAEKLLRTKEQFLANMSHEIRTPLSAIIGITRQLSKTDLQDKQRDYVGTLTTSADHLLAVINDILDYSKLESGQLRLESSRFDVEKLILDVMQFFTSKANEKQLQLHANIDPAIPKELWGDTFRLRQIVMNLLSNAIKFTENGTIIISATVVKLTEEFAKLQITVADTGVGIPPEQQSIIFEEFTQADSSVSRKYGGTGLGLTIVKKLTELQGGEISLTSLPNEGTTVRIVISYNLQGNPNAEKPTATEYSLPENTKILVIDDDEVNRLIVVEMAKSLGLEVDSLAKPEIITEYLEKNEYKAILTDIQMPGISGYDVVKIVEQQDYKIPVVAITANSMIDNPEHFISMGFSGYLIKPFIEDDLLNALAPIIGIDKRIRRKESLRKNKIQHNDKFDLSDIYRFADGDSQAVKLILSSFLDNTYKNMGELETHIKAKEIAKASAVAHKMKSAFNQFKIYHIASLLQKMELLDTGKYKAAAVYYEELNRQIRPIIKEIKMRIDSLAE